MPTTEITFKLRRDPAADWAANNPVLQDGEPGWEEDTGKFKIGNGVTPWLGLSEFINITQIATLITNAIATHNLAADPHGDRAWTTTQINNLIGGAPGILDTLGEIATALADDDSAVAALTTVVNSKISATEKGAASGVAPLDAGSKLPEAHIPTRLGVDALNGKQDKNLPTGITPRTRNFDPVTSIYNLHALNTLKTRAIVAKARNNMTAARIVVAGHSNAAGVGGNIGIGDVSTWLRRMFEASGVPSLGTGYIPTAFNVSGDWDDRWGYSSGIDRTNWEPYAWFPAPGQGKQYGFTVDRPATHIDIASFQNNGPWTYQIGTDAPVTVTPTGANERVVITVARRVENGEQILITSTNTNQAQGFVIGGIRLRNGTTGVEVTNMGISGSMADHWRPTYGGANSWYNAYSQMMEFALPDVVILELEGNEVLTAGYNPETYRTNMQQIITALQAAGVEVKLVRIIDPVNDGTQGFNAITQTQWNTYGNIQYDLADQFDVPLLDLTHRFGPKPGQTDPLDIMSDLAHMNQAGYAETARGMWRLLGEPVGVDDKPKIAKDSTFGAVMKAQTMITGGGTVSVDASLNISWSQRFLAIATGRGAHFSTAGFYDIHVPANGTVIPGLGGATPQTVVGGVIPLPGFHALYYIPPIGSTSASLAGNFRLVTYTGNVVIPDHWIMLAIRNGDNQTIRFANGMVLGAGQSQVHGAIPAAQISGVLPEARFPSRLANLGAPLSTNLDTALATGWVNADNTALNTPIPGGYFNVWVNSYNYSGFETQIAIRCDVPTHLSSVWFRQRNSSVWQSWRRIDRTSVYGSPWNSLGIPGSPLASAGVLAFATGYNYYLPFTVHEPVTLTSARIEPTIAGAAGTKAALSIHRTSSEVSPSANAVVADFGEFDVASTGVKFANLGTSALLLPGRYVMNQRVSANITARTLGYNNPDISNMVNGMGATPFRCQWFAPTAYTAVAAASPPVATGTNQFATAEFLSYFALGFTVTP